MKNGKRKVTIKNVADKAGVAIGTVSNVINDSATISEGTKEKVLKAIEELEYIPNPMARYMRSKKSRMIGFLIPNINNYFHSNIARTFIAKADEEDYSVLILGYNYSIEAEKKAINTLLNNNVDVILIANGYEDEHLIKKILKENTPVILVDRTTKMKSVNYIQYDNKKVIDKAVKLLKDHGYKSIGFLSEPLKLINLEKRYNNYVKALDNHGLSFDPTHVYISYKLCLDNMQNAYAYMTEILKKNKKEELPEAFLISNDLTAIGVICAMNEFGYKVPEDFGIIGCDNINIAGYTNPRLTTINQDQELMAKELWKMIKQIIENGDVKNITLQQELIVRESC